MSVFQLIYSSRVARYSPRRHAEDVSAILAVSRRRNLQARVTGFLLCETKLFLQVLEGEREAVMATLDRIRQDERHVEPTILSTREVGRRTFPEWSMGSVVRSVDHAEIYRRNGLSGPLDPTSVTAPGILALAMDLQDYELTQRRMFRAAC